MQPHKLGIVFGTHVNAWLSSRKLVIVNPRFRTETKNESRRCPV
jgi:hypothetical protein